MKLDNKSIEELKQIFIVGNKFDGYYGNGTPSGLKVVTKVSESSCWINGGRNSWNTIKDYCNNGIYRTTESDN